MDLWNGLILISFIVAVALAVPVMFLLRASVRRFMRERPRLSAEARAPKEGAAPRVPLQLVNAAAPPSEAGRALVTRMRRARWIAALVYAVAGIAAVCVLGKAAYVWPTVIIVASVAVPSFRWRLAALLVVCVALSQTIPEFVMYALPPTLLLIVAANRWLKSISLVIALVAFAAFGAVGMAEFIAPRYPTIGYLVPLVVLFAVDLWVVHLVVRGYERKLFSDASYQFAFVWVMFVPWWLNLERAWWRAAAALALYAVLTHVALPLLLARRPPVSLLVLRVFGSPGHSQRLFEEVGARWRYAGPIHLIASADSATVNLDLPEAVRYLTFRFRSLYVSDDRDLERRLATLDCAPDPDGRHRVNDFFCFDDTWKRTFMGLLHRADVVLVDLSGYGPRNAGVMFELGHLLATRPLDSFVLVTDRHTDVDHLGATLQRLWRALDPSLPNAQLAYPVLRVLHAPKPPDLVAALSAAAVAAQSAWGGRGIEVLSASE
jgi:hypothetical protein